jgi:hypothetical protein
MLRMVAKEVHTHTRACTHTHTHTHTQGIPDHRSVHHFLENFDKYAATIDLVIRFLQVRV